MTRKKRRCANCIYFDKGSKADSSESYNACKLNHALYGFVRTTPKDWCSKGLWIEKVVGGERHFSYSTNDEGEGYLCKDKEANFCGGTVFVTSTVGGINENTEK